MRDSADMPQLKEDSASTLVNGFHDSTPGSYLFGGMNAWSIDVALAHGRDLRRLGHDESSRSALCVVSRSEFAWHAICVCAVACKGRHEDAICQDQRSKLNRFEEIRHFCVPVVQRHFDDSSLPEVGKSFYSICF
jgi:hypothetical protein